MNILLLGNGYDLNYKLPTSYRNFLLTIDFLINHNIDEINNVGDVYGNLDLYNSDDFIKKSYDLYKDIYTQVELDKDTLQNMVDKMKNNVWFSYLIKSFNKDIGWIDFEKEIAYVIDCFQCFFTKAKLTFYPEDVCNDDSSKYIILGVFNFFIEGTFNPYIRIEIDVKSEYTIEHPFASKNYIINKEKIITVLHNQLNELTEVLKMYLHSFIDNTTKLLVEQSKISKLEIMENNDVVISFNYTNTYELFYPDVEMFHVHGCVDDKIVLGINADENDNEESVDVSFLEFKKYYQRTYYGTDISYLRWLREYLDEGGGSEDIHLLVMGHSLDVTDKDYIRELFGISSKITVLYHNDFAKSQYIKNLVKIFGVDEFEEIRDEKQLEFLSLNSDLSKFCKERADNSTTAYNNRQFSYIDQIDRFTYN